MSTHKSLITRNRLQRSRNVLKRIERLHTLKERGRWTDGDSVFSLPMTRTQFKVRKGKKKDEETADETGADATDATDAAE